MLSIYLTDNGVEKGVKRGRYNTLKYNEVSCAECGKQYKKKASLLQHFRASHLKRRTLCPVCGISFVSNSALNKHKNTYHQLMAIAKSDSSTAKSDSSTAKFSMKENQQFGVHMVAESHIRTWQVILKASPFACIEYLVSSSSGCFECGRIMKEKVKCPNCMDIWFCSNLCKASRQHKEKCDTTFKSCHCRIFRLTMRIIETAIEKLGGIKKLLNVPIEDPQYREMQCLKEEVDLKNAEIARGVVQLLSSKYNECENMPVIERKLFFLSYKHANTLKLNAFSEQLPFTKGGAFVRYYIFDTLSRFNHACDANVEQYLDDENITRCVASRDIVPSEQLFIDYLNGMEFKNQHEKKQYLKEGWNFDCQCSKCANI